MDLDIGNIEGILTAGFFNQMCLMPKLCNFKIRLNFCNKKSLLGQKVRKWNPPTSENDL